MSMKGYGRGSPERINKGHVTGDGGPTEAVTELYRQHPHHYDQHGPFHGTDDHATHSTPVKPNRDHPYGGTR